MPEFQQIAYLGKLKLAHWKYPEKQGDGSHDNPYIAGWPEYDDITSEFMHKMYQFVLNEGQNYDEVIFKSTGHDFHNDLTTVDVSKLDGNTILYTIFLIVRGERFFGGLFGSYVAKGTMDKWLAKLQELDV